MMGAWAALAISVLSINTVKDVGAEAITSLSGRNPLWRVTDNANGVVCYIILPERGMEAPATMQCVQRQVWTDAAQGLGLMFNPVD